MGTIISHVYVLFLLQIEKEKEKSGKYLENTIQLAEEYRVLTTHHSQVHSDGVKSE